MWNIYPAHCQLGYYGGKFAGIVGVRYSLPGGETRDPRTEIETYFYINHLGFFWIEPGEWYFLFPLFFAGLVLYSIYLLAHQYHQTIGTQLKQQIKYQLLGALIGFGGGLTNFLPQLFDIFPFGNYVITLYVLFIGYSVISNRLFNLKTVAIELFVGGASLVFLINLLVSETPRDWFMRFVFFLLTLFFSFLIIRFVHRIEKLAEELEDANKQQGSLIHLISHEVKNGLGKANDVFAEIVEGNFDADVSGLKEFTRAALHDNRKVVEQVEDVLRSADFKTGKISYDKKLFDFREALQESTEKYKAEAEAKGLAFRVCIAEEQNYTVNGDRALIIGHLFKNLLENAINFTPQGSITVSLSARYGKVMLVVTDTGIGITPDDMKRLFTEGGHGKDSIKINVHSTGYGLFIAKQIVEAHGGRIWAESPASVHDYGEAKAGAGKGASFFVELPVVQLDSN